MAQMDAKKFIQERYHQAIVTDFDRWRRQAPPE